MQLVEDLKLGLSEPFFHWVVDVGVDSRGRIYVLDGYPENKVHKFDAEGRHVNTFGGEGLAPGELRYPQRLMVADDSVMVFDSESRKVLVFDPDGTPRGSSARITSSDTTYVSILGHVDAGFLGLESEYPQMGKNTYSDAVAAFVQFDGSVGPPLLESPPQERINVTNPGGNAAFASRPENFYRETVCTTLADRFYCAWTGELVFRGATAAGRMLGPIDVAYEPVEVTAAERAAAEERMTPKMLAVSRRHETHPALSGLASDDRGRLWARVRLKGNESVTNYWIVDPQNMTSSAASIDGNVDIRTVRGDAAYAVVQSAESGVLVVRYRVNR